MPKPEQRLGVRHLQVLIAFLASFMEFSLRTTLSVSVIAMVDKSHSNPHIPVYEWDAWVSSLLLSSLSWGYPILQVPAGALSARYGTKNMVLLSQCLPALFSLLIPLAASVGGWSFVCACRFMQGLAQGIFLPATQSLLAKWIPAEEREKLYTVVTSGSILGSVVGMSVCGWLSSSAVGWPASFYLFGVLGLGVTVLIYFLLSDSPAKDPRITQEEREYIEQSLRTSHNTNTTLSTPWKAIMTSSATWAIIVANTGCCWGFWMLLTEMPTFWKMAMELSVTSSGLLSALPYFAMFLLTYVFGYAGGFINNKKLLSVCHSRKLFHLIGCLCPGAGLVGLCYITNTTLATVLLTVTVGTSAAAFVGSTINHFDIAPNFAGAIFGIAMTTANIAAIFSPLFVGAIVTDEKSVDQWRIVFFTSAGIYLVTGIFFAVFAEGDLQWWNDPPQISNKESIEKIQTNNSLNGSKL